MPILQLEQQQLDQDTVIQKSAAIFITRMNPQEGSALLHFLLLQKHFLLKIDLRNVQSSLQKSYWTFFFQFYIFRSRRLKATFKKVFKVARVVPEVLVSHAVCKDVQSNNTLVVSKKVLIHTSALVGVAYHLKLDV